MMRDIFSYSVTFRDWVYMNVGVTCNNMELNTTYDLTYFFFGFFQE